MNKTKLKNFNPMALREKYSAKSMSSKNNYSSFWLDDQFDRHTSIFDDEEDVKPKTDLIALSSYRRAIANFVRIVTEKDIIYIADNIGYAYSYNYKANNIIWAKNYKIPFSSNLKILKKLR